MSSKDSCFTFTEGQRQSMKQLVRAVPDIFVGANAEAWLELLTERLSYEAIDAISAYEQIALTGKISSICDFMTIVDLNAKLLGALLQNVEQCYSSNPRETVSVN